MIDTMADTNAGAAIGSAAPAAASAQTLLIDNDGVFARNASHASFRFEHRLKGHPIFELSSLIELSRRLPAHPDFAYWSNGRVSVTDPWEKGMSERYSLQDTIANIASNNSIVILKHTEQDPVFGPVLRKLLSEFVALSGRKIAEDVIVGEALILVSSPGRITPYHFDAELNFLVQVTGDKTFNVFDHTVATQVTAEELERFVSGAPSAGVYGDAKQANATVYDLRAGQGVHIPSFAPHWVQNGDNISIALSINYEMRSIEKQSRVHWFNHRLRKLGIQPTPPGPSAWRDAIKRAMATCLVSARKMLKPTPPTPDYAVWTPGTPN